MAYFYAPISINIEDNEAPPDAGAHVAVVPLLVRTVPFAPRLIIPTVLSAVPISKSPAALINDVLIFPSICENLASWQVFNLILKWQYAIFL